MPRREKIKNEFDSPFWQRGFRVQLKKNAGPVAVARFTQSNKFMAADKRFRTDSGAAAAKFVQMTRKF